MPSVTVDLGDLETLVWTTAALKTIEGALQARKNDPFVRPHLDFTAAHDRLAATMRNARRVEAGTVVAWDGALEDDEIKALRRVDSSIGLSPMGVLQIPSGEKGGVFDRLQAKGCVQYGQYIEGHQWAGEQPQMNLDPSCYLVRLTDRGREKLAKLDAERPR